MRLDDLLYGQVVSSPLKVADSLETTALPITGRDSSSNKHITQRLLPLSCSSRTMLENPW